MNKIKLILQRLRGGSVEYDLQPYREMLTAIKSFQLTGLPDEKLKTRARELSSLAKGGASLDDLLAEVFALAGEAAGRVISLKPFDVQIMAGVALHRGRLVQMQTGEGKTLAAVLPVLLNALAGQGVHVLTANDYLAQRDAQWMGPIYDFFGLRADFIREGMTTQRRQTAYRADITYLTAKEAGFDFLRDQLCYSSQDLVQRPFHFAIVDEADFIMIDEARVPLVIAGEAPEAETNPLRMAETVRLLEPGRDYETDENRRSVSLTENGLDRVEELLKCGSLHDPGNLLLFTSINAALHAEVLLHRDIDYIVRDGKIELVDEFTGRIADKRRWPHGLQAAVEAKEGVALQPEGRIYGSIALQHFLQLYPRLSGMTATAEAAAQEFKTMYDLNVVVIPPNKPCIRIDLPDVVFTNKAAKQNALVKEISRVYASGRPVLVGTASVAESEALAESLKQLKVPCRVLNAKNDDVEAKIIARAGTYKAVTISTNMAGRGTDIRLGGEQEEEREAITARGGLYVVGTNRHESRRIDNQLRGRAGRQGDPGASRFFISMEDDLMERYNLQALLPNRYAGLKQDEPLADPIVEREIARAQRIIEGQNFEIRRTLHNYSLIIEMQREMTQSSRRDILLGEDCPALLEAKAAGMYRDLCAIHGKEILEKVEREITLFHQDRCWSDYLARVADIREGIHLQRLGGKSPWIEFQMEADREFKLMQAKLEEEILQSFKTVTISKDGIDTGKEGLKGPSATWTYLINDNPFSNLGIDLIASRNIGLSAGAGLVAAYYFPVTIFLIISRFIGRLIKKSKRKKNPKGAN